MAGIFESFKRGLNGDYGYQIADKQVVCSHCGGAEFEETPAQLNTAGLTFLGLDWANRSARVLVCKNCHHLEWFL